MAVIIHADMDAFYASIEQRDNPALRGKPIAVGGDPNRRGVVMTASYEARTYGVRSAMPSRTAVGLCRDLILVPPRFQAYTDASRQIMAIFSEHAQAVEPMSLDEAFLDVSDRAPTVPAARELALEIKHKVRDATRLTVSFGVAGTKLVAKIASDFHKPDGLTCVEEANMTAFLAPLPIRKIWGIGPKSEERLVRSGFRTIGELAAADDDAVLGLLGPGGFGWRSMARGEDPRRVAPRDRNRQISREITFDRDTDDLARISSVLTGMAESIARSIGGSGVPRTVHIKLRYADFRTITRQVTCGSVTTPGQITQHALALVDQHWDRRKIRLIGVGVSGFPEHGQLSLFEGPTG
jgi:DNA polymerase-4